MIILLSGLATCEEDEQDRGKSKEPTSLWTHVMCLLTAILSDVVVDTAIAAGGCLALLSSSPEVCQRIVDEKQGLGIVMEMCVRTPTQPL